MQIARNAPSARSSCGGTCVSSRREVCAGKGRFAREKLLGSTQNTVVRSSDAVLDPTPPLRQTLRFSSRCSV
eukprot:3046142-Pleurochrysis_carterae.AAC.1